MQMDSPTMETIEEIMFSDSDESLDSPPMSMIDNIDEIDDYLNEEESCSLLSSVEGPTKISMSPGGTNVWGIDDLGNVFCYNFSISDWVYIPGVQLKQIDASLSSSGALQVCGVDFYGNGFMYNIHTGAWNEISKPTSSNNVKFEWIETGNGFICALLSTGALFCGSF